MIALAATRRERGLQGQPTPAEAALRARRSHCRARALERLHQAQCLSRRRRLHRLRHAGCATLEVGLETIDPEHQRLIAKRQSVPLFLRLLDAAAEAELGLVINYITGFPGQDPAAAAHELDWLRREIARRPGLHALVEHNEFQLERPSPMVLSARSHGLAITGEWPWSSVLGWRMVAKEKKRTRLEVVTQ